MYTDCLSYFLAFAHDPSAAQLRQLIHEGTLVTAPGAPDALTARLVEQTGFPAVYMTGFGATATCLGAPDLGLLT